MSPTSWGGPSAPVRVGGSTVVVINPTFEQMEQSDLDLRQPARDAILMVECGASEMRNR